MKNILIKIFILISFFSFSQTVVITENEKQYQKISRENYTIGQINSLLVSYKDSLNIASNNKNIKEVAFSNLILSKLYYKLGAYNESINYGNFALKDYEKLNDTIFTMYCLIGMGAFYGDIQENEIALEYFLKFEELAIQSKETMALAYNYINMALIYSDTDYKKAIAYIDKADDFRINNKQDKYFNFYVFNSRANIYFKQGDYEKALNSFLEAYPLLDSNHFFYASSCSNIAETYNKLGFIDSALYYNNLALKGNPEVQSMNNFANTYAIFTDIYLKMQIVDSARVYFELFKKYNDSLILNKKIEYVSKLKVIHETNKLLENNKEQKQKLDKYKLQEIFLITIVLIIIIALVIFFIIYIKLKLSYKNIVKESVQSLKIEQENIDLKNTLLSFETTTKKSEINIENSDEIFERIMDLFVKDKLYTDEDFSINKVAEVLDTNRTYISNIINSKTGDSFVKLLNTFRIKQVKKMLIDDKNKFLTLDAISRDAGFKSTSTFNRVFKAETGVTPSFYVKNKNI